MYLLMESKSVVKATIIQLIYYWNIFLHTLLITIGSKTVFVNGKGCGRVGDAITSYVRVIEQFSNVFAGG